MHECPAVGPIHPVRGKERKRSGKEGGRDHTAIELANSQRARKKIDIRYSELLELSHAILEGIPGRY